MNALFDVLAALATTIGDALNALVQMLFAFLVLPWIQWT